MKRLRHWINCIGKALVAGALVRANVVDDNTDIRPVKGVLTLFDEAVARWPDATPAAIDELMWLTPYPAADRATVVASLSQMRERWGPKIADAINGEMAEFNTVWKGKRNDTNDTK